MDKVEYKIRADEIQALIGEGNFADAVKVADTIDWKRVKSVSMLCTISDLYKINRRFEESKDILLMAYDRHPTGRKIVFSLCELSIKMGEFVQAVEYYKEFVRIAPRDTGRYILQYRLYEAQEVSLEERIAVLEEFKKHDYTERWAYELAYLYHRVGLTTECIEECDEIFLWFGEGRYVMKALELKALHEPLSAEQQDRYVKYKQAHGGVVDKSIIAEKDEVGRDEARTVEIRQPTKELPDVNGDMAAPSTVNRQLRAPEDELGQTREFKASDLPRQSQAMPVTAPSQPVEDKPAKRDPYEIVYPHISEIKEPSVDVSTYNTMNLQESLAQSLREVIGDKDSSVTDKDMDAATKSMDQTAAVQPITEEIFDDDETGPTRDISAAAQAVSEGYGSYVYNSASEETGSLESYDTGEIPEDDTSSWSADEEDARDSYGEWPSSGYAQGGESEDNRWENSSYPQDGNTSSWDAHDYSQESDTTGWSTSDYPQDGNTSGWEAPEYAGDENGAGYDGEYDSRNYSDRDSYQDSYQAQDGYDDSITSEIPTDGMQELFFDTRPQMGIEIKYGGNGPILGEEKISDTQAELPIMATTQEDVIPEAPEPGPNPVIQPFKSFDYDERPLEDEVPGAVIHPNANYQMHNHFENMLTQDYDGQISMAVEPEPEVEKQITGQISIAEYLQDWEQFKKDQQQKQLERVKQRVADETGDMFSEFDEKTKAGLQEKIEKAISDAIRKESYSRASGRSDWTRKKEDVINTAVDEVISQNTAELAAEELQNLEDYAEYDNEYEGDEYYGPEDGGYESAADDTYPEDEDNGAEYDMAEAGEYTGSIEGVPEEPDEMDEDNEPAEEVSEAPEADEKGTESENDAKTPGEFTQQLQAIEEELNEEKSLNDAAQKEGESATADATEGVSAEADSSTGETAQEKESANDDKDAADDDEGQSDVSVSEVKEDKKETETAAEKSTDEHDDKETHEEDHKRRHIGNRELEERVRSMTPEEKELFGPYIHHKKSRRQIINAIDNLNMDAFSGNAIVTGEEGAGTVNLAKGLIKAMQASDSNFSGKVAKITANTLNKKSTAAIFDKLADGALIIQRAADLTDETVGELIRILQSYSRGLVLVMEDSKEDMDRFMDRNPSLRQSFNVRVDIEALDDDSLVAYARQYALEKEFAIDNLGILALHTRISERQTLDHDVTVSEVKDIVDDAIYYAEKRSFGHFVDVLVNKRYDENDMIILREKDFMH